MRIRLTEDWGWEDEREMEDGTTKRYWSAMMIKSAEGRKFTYARVAHKTSFTAACQLVAAIVLKSDWFGTMEKKVQDALSCITTPKRPYESPSGWGAVATSLLKEKIVLSEQQRGKDFVKTREHKVV
jgi:hypothetical protein